MPLETEVVVEIYEWTESSKESNVFREEVCGIATSVIKR